ncbi:MAG TPA: hypothetical protein VIF15_09125 [Polyangiaceae bacterium]
MLNRSMLARARFWALPFGIAAIAAAVATPADAYTRYGGPGTVKSPGVQPMATGNVTYQGGHVISHTQIVLVIWGSAVSPTVASSMPGFYGSIVSGPFMDWMGEYDTAGKSGGTNQHVNRGTFLKTVTITPANTATSLVDTDIQTELSAQITSGVLPKPVIDAEGAVNTLYMVHFPPGTSITDPANHQSCVGGGFCAYHGTFSMSGVATGVPYGVMPDFSQDCASGCGDGSTEAVNLGEVGSHEVAEAITDTEIGINSIAWYDNNAGEVGDICASAGNYAAVGAYRVQKIWSQKNKSCIAEDPNLPLCSSGTRPCRPCTATDCTGATPICDSTTGVCRGCTSKADCSGATPACNTTSGQCVGCVNNTDCPSGQTCNTATSTCAGGSGSGSGGSSGGSGSSSGSSSGGGSGSSSGGSGSGGSSGSGSGGSGSGSGGSGSGSGGSGSGGSDAGTGDNAFGSTTTTSGCAMSPGGATTGMAGVGLLMGLAAIARRRKR